MRFLALLIVTLIPAFAVTAPSVVTDTLLDQSLQPIKGGVISITFPYVCTEPGGQIVEAVFVNVPISSVGVFTVSLAPTDVCVPSGTSYSVTYSLPNGVTRAPETWTVPSSGTPIGLSSVVTFPTPVPSFVVALSVLGQGGATTGQCISWSGSSWVPGSCGNLPSIVTPGTNTKITYNAQGLVTAGVQANFTDFAGSIALTQTPLTTSQDILFDNAGSLGRLPISLVANGSCLGNSGGVWATMACSGGAGSGTVINDTTLTNNTLVGGAGTVHVKQVDLSGDVTTSSGLATTLATVNSNIGTCGDATHVGQVTLNGKGLATACAPISISNSFPSASAQLQALRIKAGTGNLTTTEFAGPFVFYPEDYAFTAQAPGGSLTGGGGNQTINLSPCPLGMNGSDTGHYVYLSGGTGTAEAKPIVSGTCTSGAASGTILVAPTNSHSGAWTVGPATAGIQEAIVAAAGSQVKLHATTYVLNAPVYICQGTLSGAGMFNSILQIQTASGGAIDAPCQKDTFEDFGITTLALTPGTSGNYGIRLGNGGGHDNSFTRINRLYLEPLYDAILCVNCSQTEITNNVFYNFQHTGITAVDTTNPDNDGPWVRGNVFFNYNSYSTPALACLYATSSGGITFTENNCYGSNVIGGSVQLQYNVNIAQTASTQITIANNILESASVQNINITGVFNLIAITGNTIAQPVAAQNLWRAIEISGNNTTSSCGTGIGICSVAVTGNTIQGPGATSTSSVGIELSGFTGGAFIGGNAINFSQIGINIGSSVTTTKVGQNQIAAYSAALFGGSAGTFWDSSGQVTYAQRPTAANGSRLYFTDSNSACTAGSSAGQWCQLISGSWTH